MAFTHELRVAFVDTDAMGVVHHSVYLNYCEEARVEWIRAVGLGHTHYPETDKVMAVLQYRMWHLRPARFDDLLRIEFQVRREGLKIRFQYAIYKGTERIAQAETLHIPVDKDLKPAKLSREVIGHLEKEQWTETWLLNL